MRTVPAQGLGKKKNEILLFCARLFVTLLQAAKLLRLGNKKKSKLSFYISLDFS